MRKSCNGSRKGSGSRSSLGLRTLRLRTMSSIGVEVSCDPGSMSCPSAATITMPSYAIWKFALSPALDSGPNILIAVALERSMPRRLSASFARSALSLACPRTDLMPSARLLARPPSAWVSNRPVMSACAISQGCLPSISRTVISSPASTGTTTEPPPGAR